MNSTAIDHDAAALMDEFAECMRARHANGGRERSNALNSAHDIMLALLDRYGIFAQVRRSKGGEIVPPVAVFYASEDDWYNRREPFATINCY